MCVCGYRIMRMSAVIWRMVFPVLRERLTVMIKIGACKKPLQRGINPLFLSCPSHILRESWGVVTEHHCAKLQCYQSTEKSMWVEDACSSGLQFNASVTCWWKALISDTFSVCFLVDKDTWGIPPFKNAHAGCVNTSPAKLLIGSSPLQTHFIDPRTLVLSSYDVFGWFWWRPSEDMSVGAEPNKFFLYELNTAHFAPLLSADKCHILLYTTKTWSEFL